jgi:hypothetical protein
LIAQLQAAGRESLDLLHPHYRNSDRSEYDLNGLCYALCEALYRLAPERFTPRCLPWQDGGTHWFLKDHDGAIIDMVSYGYPEPLCTAEEYTWGQPMPLRSHGRISWRARALIERAGLTFPTPAPTQQGA